MKILGKFLLHFIGWLIGILLALTIVIAPLILAQYYNNAWWLLCYVVIIAIIGTIYTFND